MREAQGHERRCGNIKPCRDGLTRLAAAPSHPASRTVISRLANKQPVVALTFDDGPDPVFTPRILDVLDAHDVRVNEHNRVALADVRPKPVPAGAAGYVGAARCGDCHESAFAWWKEHAHGHAYATLEKRNKQFSLSCVGCHVTGYNEPGGASVVQN